MDDNNAWLLEIRLFKVRPGTREEFDRTSRDGTIPLMRSLGIRVIKHGPSENNENGYYLIRAFRSETERVALSQALYVNDEWLAKYENSVPDMIEDYDTAVMPVTEAALQQLSAEIGQQ